MSGSTCLVYSSTRTSCHLASSSYSFQKFDHPFSTFFIDWCYLSVLSYYLPPMIYG